MDTFDKWQLHQIRFVFCVITTTVNWPSTAAAVSTLAERVDFVDKLIGCGRKLLASGCGASHFWRRNAVATQTPTRTSTCSAHDEVSKTVEIKLFIISNGAKTILNSRNSPQHFIK